MTKMATTTQRKTRAKGAAKEVTDEVGRSSQTRISVIPLQREAVASPVSELDGLPVCLMRLTHDLCTSYINARGRRSLRTIDGLLDVPEDRLFRVLLERFHADPVEFYRRLQDPSEDQLQLHLTIEGLEWAWEISRSDAEFVLAWHVRPAVAELQCQLSRLESALEQTRREATAREAASAKLVADATERSRVDAASLRNDIDALVGALNRVANGELGLELPRFEDATVQRVVDALDHLLGGLKRSINSLETTADSLAASADQLTNVGERMLSGAHATRERSESASKGSQDVHEHVLSVATSAEEMAASAREIAISASKAASVATHAVGVAQSTSTTVSELAESGEAIGKVVKVINSIAEQTNLLALNATIEAARAGEAGKGFAVVANEVKELAKETAKATTEIGDRIEAIQSNTQRVARAIDEIGSVVNQIHSFQATIATAVEQQHSVTTEISQRALGAAESTADIAENTRSVQHAAASTAESAQETQVAARAVASTAFELKRIVSDFRA